MTQSSVNLIVYSITVQRLKWIQTFLFSSWLRYLLLVAQLLEITVAVTDAVGRTAMVSLQFLVRKNGATQPNRIHKASNMWVVRLLSTVNLSGAVLDHAQSKMGSTNGTLFAFIHHNYQFINFFYFYLACETTKYFICFLEKTIFLEGHEIIIIKWIMKWVQL